MIGVIPGTLISCLAFLANWDQLQLQAIVWTIHNGRAFLGAEGGVMVVEFGLPTSASHISSGGRDNGSTDDRQAQGTRGMECIR